jgi:hypothetical protein
MNPNEFLELRNNREFYVCLLVFFVFWGQVYHDSRI